MGKVYTEKKYVQQQTKHRQYNNDVKNAYKVLKSAATLVLTTLMHQL